MVKVTPTGIAHKPLQAEERDRRRPGRRTVAPAQGEPHRSQPLEQRVLALQHAVGNRAVVGVLRSVMLSPVGGRVLQRNWIEVPVDPEDHTKGYWLIRQAGIDVNIEYQGKTWGPPSHPLHRSPVGGLGGNDFYGGYTILYGRQNQVTHAFSNTLHFTPKVGEHTEKRFIEKIEADVDDYLRRADVIGVVIEINQRLAICSTCQTVLADFVRGLKTATGKAAFVRAQAAQRYESHGGELGKGMQQLQHQKPSGQEDPPPTMSADPAGWVGTHNYIPPPY